MPEQKRPLQIRITGEDEGAEGEVEGQRDEQKDQNDRVCGRLGKIRNQLAFENRPDVFHKS